MVSRLFITIFFIISTVNILSANNLLKDVKVENNTIKLTFKNPLKRKDFVASAIKGTKLTKYVFDFKKCYLSKKVKDIKHLRYPIKSIRVAQYKPEITRLVIDSAKPYTFKYHQHKKPIFYIDLPNVKLSKKHKKESVKNLFSNVHINRKKPKVEVIPTSYSANLKKRYTVVLDPGHGGHDPGTTWHGYKEKVLVMQITKRVYRRLKSLGFNVRLTRYRDKFIKLSHRTRKANKLNADLFVSIHANSVKNKARARIARGIETYFLQTTRNARAKRVAAKENAEILKGKDSATKRTLLNAVFTGPKIALSNRLAIDVQSRMLSNLRAKYKGIKDNGVRGAPFYVLVGAEMPSVLIEVGYLSNPKERARLFNPHYQELQAKGIVEGIVRYLKNRERELE